MREIKFRCWDEQLKKMLSTWRCEDVTDDIQEIANENSVILMQYTSLKDKNGTEIYEGDVPGGKWGDLSIIWCDKCCSFQLAYEVQDGRQCGACDNDFCWQEFIGDIKDTEIIGNIYQNPELLEAK